MEHLFLPVLDEAGELEGSREMLEAEPLGRGLFRLLHSPAFVDGIAAGDVIEVLTASTKGFRVISRSGNLAIVVAFPDAESKSAAASSVAEEVAALGGTFEGGPSGAAVFTIPLSVGFQAIEQFFNSRCNANGVLWWFGNVYGPNGKPLEWWKQ